MGDIEMKKMNLDEALRLLKMAVGAKSDLRFAYIDLGAILMRQKKFTDAVAPLQRAEALDPSQPDAHYRLGQTYQALGKIAESQKELAKVRELHQKQDDPLASKMSAAPPPLPQ